VGSHEKMMTALGKAAGWERLGKYGSPVGISAVVRTEPSGPTRNSNHKKEFALNEPGSVKVIEKKWGYA
jgi:hypothetical protein